MDKLHVAKSLRDYKTGLKDSRKNAMLFPNSNNMTMRGMNTPVKYYGLTNNEITDQGIAYPGQDFNVKGDHTLEVRMKNGGLMKIKKKYQSGGPVRTDYTNDKLNPSGDYYDPNSQGRTIGTEGDRYNYGQQGSANMNRDRGRNLRQSSYDNMIAEASFPEVEITAPPASKSADIDAEFDFPEFDVVAPRSGGSPTVSMGPKVSRTSSVNSDGERSYSGSATSSYRGGTNPKVTMGEAMRNQATNKNEMNIGSVAYDESTKTDRKLTAEELRDPRFKDHPSGYQTYTEKSVTKGNDMPVETKTTINEKTVKGKTEFDKKGPGWEDAAKSKNQSGRTNNAETLIGRAYPKYFKNGQNQVNIGTDENPGDFVGISGGWMTDEGITYFSNKFGLDPEQLRNASSADLIGDKPISPELKRELMVGVDNMHGKKAAANVATRMGEGTTFDSYAENTVKSLASLPDDQRAMALSRMNIPKDQHGDWLSSAKDYEMSGKYNRSAFNDKQRAHFNNQMKQYEGKKQINALNRYDTEVEYMEGEPKKEETRDEVYKPGTNLTYAQAFREAELKGYTKFYWNGIEHAVVKAKDDKEYEENRRKERENPNFNVGVRGRQNSNLDGTIREGRLSTPGSREVEINKSDVGVPKRAIKKSKIVNATKMKMGGMIDNENYSAIKKYRLGGNYFTNNKY